ncbi:NAD-dependent protein deacylase sirtuin-5 [Nibea albiflora]|uniref:NAD-dependent protein deacylase sirtuin-5 n=1 Tax=Nibea albiflora TaxID=240163 RepID=A0ACB7FK00_NIBAL|nr:NAD-dependent protein deacylase sirtuin-5 [Nibea albiflora]
MYYGLLEEFVSTVLEKVPELLTHTERVQLVMGLRAKVVLELCRNDDFANPQAMEPHLSRINTYITHQDKDTSSSEVKASVTNFLKLIHTLVDDQCQRDIFYQKIFSTVFGPKYDSALQALMRKFLFSLQKLLPVPNLEQVALSSNGDDCILSSLSYHLPNVDDDEGDTLVKSESTCVSQECQGSNLLESESKKIKEEDFKGMHSQQHVGGLTEDQGASVEVILQPFDDSGSDDDDMDTESFRHLKTGSRTSSKTFRCVVCGQDFRSLNKLKKHKATHSCCPKNKVSQSESQSSFFEKIHLHPKPKTRIENNASQSKAELPTLASATTLNQPNLNSLTNFKQSKDDFSLVCHSCGKVFTYPKNFDKHQRNCGAGSKRQEETDPPCSTSLAPHSKPNPDDKTKESLPSETETGPSIVLPQESISSESAQEQTCKRSSRAKQCSVCGKIFTCSTGLMRHMRCHTEQSPYLCSHCGKGFDNDEDCKTHEEGKCRVLSERSQDNSPNTAMRRNQKNTVVSSGTYHVPTNTEAPTNSEATEPCKLPLTCQECGQGFTYYKSFEKHQSRCSKRPPRKKTRTRINKNHFVISACNFKAADNTDRSCTETSSETTKTPTPADHAYESQAKSRTMKCTMCEKNFSEIILMKRHYSKSHKVRGSYPCPLCKRAFVRLCELVRHQQNKKLYQCTACKKCYTKPGLLNDHEKIHTASVTPHICETCGKSFRYLTHLILHQSKHRDQQPSVCSYCGKQFSTKDYLRAHMVRHTGGYPCPVCGKKFYQKTYLKWHLYKHTGQEPYLCDTCGKGWPSAAQLKLHMVQHTEERPFKCEDCDACYKRGSHLMAHRRAKHLGLRPFVCEDLATPEAFSRNPSRVWEFYHYRRELALSKKPSAAHLAIAECEARLRKQGRSVVVITQCIDDLHRQAGSKHVLKVHGSLLETRCVSCGEVTVNKRSPICAALKGKG